MEDSILKEKVLKEARNALINRIHNPFSGTDLNKPVFPELSEDIEVVFAENLTANGAKFIYCGSREEFIETVYLVSHQNNWKNVVCHEQRVKEILDDTKIDSSEDTDTSKDFVYVTTCEAMVARHGSIILSSAQPLSQKALALAHTHVVFALANQMHDDMQPALKAIEKRHQGNLPSNIISITGKSKNTTPAIKEIPAASGAKELVVFFIDAR